MKTPKQIKHSLAENWEDAFVDEKIRDLVRVLNRKSLGIRTIAACEGHFKYPNSPYLYFHCPVQIAEMVEKRVKLELVRDAGLNYGWHLEGTFNQHFKLAFVLRSRDLQKSHDKSFLSRFWTYKIQRQKIDEDLALLAQIIDNLLNEFETSSEFEIPDPYDEKNHSNKKNLAFFSGLLTKWIWVTTKLTRVFPKNTLKNRLSFTHIALFLVIGILLWLGFTQVVFASEQNYGTGQVTSIRSVYDGDTFRADINGWPIVADYGYPVRVAGVDTPEIKGKCAFEINEAIKAREFSSAVLKNASYIELRNMRLGKYSRIVAEVWIDGHDLAAMLIEKSLGRAYDGRKRRGWC